MKYFLFDTETTDLTKPSLQPLSKQPHIVDFYGCVWDDKKGRVVDELEFLCKPPVPCSPKAEETHHITADMLADKPEFSTFAPMVKAIIEESDAVVAHNFAYDYRLVEYEMKRAGFLIDWPIRRICTVENTIHLKGYRLPLGPKKKEMGLYHYLFGETFEGAHSAKNDTLALLRCFVELLKRGEI